MKNLLLSGGIFHPFAETTRCIAGYLDRLGIHSEIVGVQDGFVRLRSETFDLVTINALSWSMTQDDKYQPYRDEFAFSPNAADRAALETHLAAGAGLLGLHTAAICFDSWPEWPSILGVGWIWGKSHHPKPDHVRIEGHGESFEIWDELYCDLSLDKDTQVLATGTVASVNTRQPVLMAKGRSVYLALGHDMTATGNHDYQRLLTSAAQIALGRRES